MMRIESRKCYHCGEVKDILQRFKHANNICGDCERERNKEYQRKDAIRKGTRVGQTGRFPYPLAEEWEYMNQKFQTMAKKMKHINERRDWIIQIRKNLDEVLEDTEVMKWILAHKDEDDSPKKQKNIVRDYPNTKDMNWDDFERGGWGDIEDS